MSTTTQRCQILQNIRQRHYQRHPNTHRYIRRTHARRDKIIDDDTKRFLIQTDPKPGRFYILPKVHKQGNPGRPIVSINAHPTERISQFVDFHLKPLVQKTQSFINISHNEGIDACRHFLDTRIRNPSTISTETLCDLIHITMNNFTFNDKNYLQIHGTAMGTRMAPSYANLFLAKFETDALSRAPYQPHIRGGVT